MRDQGYVLARGFQASARLDLQAYLWRSIIPTRSGFHPSITLESEPDHTSKGEPLKIADVATGTGIFLLHLSQECSPSAVLHGFDISGDQYPHSSCLPQNVHLFVGDATKEPQEQFRGKYDLVHIRMLQAAIDGGDPAPVLNHAQLLLKKGGRLQWDELDPWALRRIPPSGNESITSTASSLEGVSTKVDDSPCLDRLVDIFRYTKETKWISVLAEHFSRHGFEVEANEVYHPQNWQRQMMMSIWCLVTDEYASQLESSGQVEKSEQLHQLVSGAYDEIKRGVLYEHSIRVVVGRKL